MTKATAQVRAFVKGDAKKKERGGVSWLASDGNAVVRFKSWSDASTLYSLQGHEIFQGVPFTQEDLDRHYPELKYRTGLTKAKIGSAKVGFLDIQCPLAIQHQGHVYMVAPMFVDTWTKLFPASMIKPTYTAEQQKYLDTHERNLYIAQKTEIIRYHVGIEKAIREAKRLEKQGHQVELEKHTPTGSRPVYTVLKVIPTHEPATPARTTRQPKKVATKPAKKPKTTKQPAPTPSVPPILTAPPELAADVLGAGLPAAPKRKTAARTTKKPTKKVPYFTISKARRLVAENFAHRSDKQLHIDIIKLHDYIRYIDVGDRDTLIRGGYFGQVVHPDASGVSPVDIFLHQNLKHALERAYAEKNKRKQAVTTEKEFYRTEYWHDPHAGRHPASGSGRLPMHETAYLEVVSVGGEPMWKMYNPVTGKEKYFRLDEKEEAKKQFKNLHKKTFGTKKPPKKTAAKPRKTTKKPAKPKAKKTTTPKLTASQREYLAIQGFVMVKRGGKYVRITG